MNESELGKDSLPIAREEVQMVLTLSGKNRIEKILASPNPAALVAKLPEIEIFLTIKEVGEQDAVDLITLTTPEQLTYLLDLDLWDKDQIAPERFVFWLEILEQCGEEKLRQFFRTTDLEFLVSSFRKLLRVLTPAHFEEPLEEEKKSPYFTLDQIHFIDFLDDKKAPLLIRLLHFLYASMRDIYQVLMEQILWSIPAEEEELALRWRNGRLADQGFPSFDEALEIYSYIPPERIKKMSSFVLPEPDKSFYPPTYLEAASKGTFFSITLQEEVPDKVRDRVKWELMGLINRVLIADGAHLGDIEALYNSARKALQILDLGLRYLSQENPIEARSILKKIPVTRIFQVGFSLTLDLKKKAQLIVHKGWLADLPRKEETLDSPLKETIKGLLQKRPMFFNEAKGIFTLFADLSEIRLTAERLEKISFLGRIIHDLFGIPASAIAEVEKISYFFPDPPLSTICLTYFAHSLLYGRKKLAPLSQAELQKIYERMRQNELLADRTKIINLWKELTMGEITAQGNNLDERSEEILRWWLNFLYQKLYSCLGHIFPGERIDPRAIDVFLVSRSD